jgi:hypothetical protein
MDNSGVLQLIGYFLQKASPYCSTADDKLAINENR